MSFKERLKNDYLIKNRYKEYKLFLEKAKDNGFVFARVTDFGTDLYNNCEKTAILRHDIDTDILIARKMFKIEKELNIKSTYYFRFSTLNKKFIKELCEFGNEVSYHFEEISTFAYKHNIANPKEVRGCFSEIQSIFEKNLQYFKKKTACNCDTVASHGDFVNRKLGIINNEFLDSKLKQKLNIRLEAYDNSLMDSTKYCSDGNVDFLKLLTYNDVNRYYILVHPRTLAAKPLTRFVIDAKRLCKGLKYKLFTKFHRLNVMLKQIHELPRDKLTFIGEKNKCTYKYFVKPHPKYKIFKNKTIGACLLHKPENFEQYLVGKDKQVVRTKRNKCLKLGYSFSELNVMEFVDDILEINLSKSERQGHEMNKDYFDKDKIIDESKDKANFGIFDINHKLVSYCYLIEAGDFIIITRLLGHSDFLNDGIMHFMISECVRLWAEGRWPNIKYFLYDTWFGALAGLKIFKSDLGFKPYRVKYRYKENEKK